MDSKKGVNTGKRRPKTHLMGKSNTTSEKKEVQLDSKQKPRLKLIPKPKEKEVTIVSEDFKRRTRIDDSEAGIPDDLFSMIFSKDCKDIKKMSEYVDEFNKINES